MFSQRFIALGLFFFFLAGGSFVARAEMEASDKDVGVRRLGVSWNIAEDRKMENISGIYEPEGLDKYMKRYFDQLTAKVDQLSSKIDKLSTQVESLEKASAKKEIAPETSQGRLV